MFEAERVYTALDGGTPDRVPVVPKIWVDLGAELTRTPLTEVITNPQIALEVIARAGAACRADAVRQFHFPPRTIREEKGRVYEIDNRGEPLGEIDMAGGLATHLRSPGAFDLADPRFTGFHHYWSASAPFVEGVDDARAITVPPKEFYIETGCAERQRQVLGQFGESIAVLGDCSSPTMAFHVCMRGMDRALFDLVEEPRLVHAVMEKGAAIAVEKGKFNVDLGINMLRLNDSVGNMSVISPDHWRSFVFPHLKDVCDALHAYDSAARIYCHICGDIMPIVEDLVDAGIDCIGPLDPLGGFTPAEVRKRVGASVSLMGGVNTLSFLEGTPERIIEESRACMEQAAQRGGYILGSGCVVPRHAPKANLLALREAAGTYGRYAGGRLTKG